MKILICTGIYPPDIGGPAIYAENLYGEFLRHGHKVRLFVYKLEKKLPAGAGHCLYFLRVLFNIYKTDLIIALDTFSVGWPAVCAAKIFKKKIIIRIGGDFLWESYVEKTGNLITMDDFNKNLPSLPFKQKMIFSITKFVLKNSEVVFSTAWQKDIWRNAYNLGDKKLFITENYYGVKMSSNEPREKNFLWFGRFLKLKNINMFKVAFEEAKKESRDIKLETYSNVSRNELMEKVKNCYVAMLPSISEVSPNFILETIQFNKPFILTKETGFYEKMKDVGVFVNPLDKEDIKNKILFLADGANYKEYKKRVESFNFTHSWQEIADEFLDIYRNL